jgi:hypothetical protein
MFDKNTFITHTHPVQRVDSNITINNAPTDESVRLLKEMEEAAEDKLLYRGEIRDNTLSAQWNVFKDVAINMYKCAVRIKLNGIDHLFKFQIEKQYGMNRFDVAMLVKDKLAVFIADEIIKQTIVGSSVDSFRGLIDDIADKDY